MIARPTLGSLPNARSFRGQPLVIMLAVLALWVGLRVSVWSPPPQVAAVSLPFAARAAADREAMARRSSAQPRSHAPWWAAASTGLPASGEKGSSTRPLVRTSVPLNKASEPADPGAVEDVVPASVHSPSPFRGSATAVRSWPWRRAQSTPDTPYSLPLGPVRASEPRRVSIDGWLFLRAGGVPDAGAGPVAPTYGESQFGATLRYDFGPRSVHRPQAYLRASAAIDSREADLAAGISIRPLPALPLRAHGELRLSRLGDRTELRPSAFVTAGLDEALPLGAQVRGYAQAGYVGGEFATPFADGSLVAEREAKRFERGALALGVGAWGGAQEGTSRLDVGPTASLDLRLGEGRLRLAADYRFRVAGQAEPASGAALTLSSSF